LDTSPSTVVALISDDLRTLWVSRSVAWVVGDDPDTAMKEKALTRVHPRRRPPPAARPRPGEGRGARRRAQPAEGMVRSMGRVVDSIGSPIQLGSLTVSVGASAGLATGRPPEVMHEADRALYGAKGTRAYDSQGPS
jgi:hypothetical protein